MSHFSGEKKPLVPTSVIFFSEFYELDLVQRFIQTMFTSSLESYKINFTTLSE